MGGGVPAIASALLLILAFPPFHLLLLPFVALVPLAVAIGSLGWERGSGRRAARLGLLFGVVHWGILLAWVPLVVAPQFSWAYPGFAVQVGLLSGLGAVMAWGTHWLHAGSRVPMGLALPLAWVSMEWLKAHFPFGLSFPWLGLGISLTSWPRLLGLAEWTGEGGVAFWLAGVNGLLAGGVLAATGKVGRGWASKRPWVLACLILGAGLLPAALGVIRARGLTLVPGPRLAVVGTRVPRELRRLPLQSSAEGLAQAGTALAALDPGAADLVILPEATVTVPLDGADGDDYRESLRKMATGAGAPILVGAMGTAREMRPDSGIREGQGTVGRGSRGAPGDPPSLRAGGGPLSNSAFLVEPGTSSLARYDKVRLVPGMEWGGFLPGRPGVVLTLDGVTLGPIICYESIFGALARDQRRSGARILINVTSDIWFGDGEGVISTLFLHQHAAHLVMRAVETRVGVARAANGGFSFLLDPVGDRVSSLIPPSGGLAIAPVPTYRGITLFARTRDLVGPGSLLVLILFLGPTFLRLRAAAAIQPSTDPARSRGFASVPPA